MWSKIFVCLATLYVVHAWVAIKPGDKKPEKYADQEGCYMAEDDKLLSFGENYTPTGGQCVRYICYNDGDIQVAGCGSVAIPPGCESTKGDNSVPYPKCCGGYKCIQTDGSYISYDV